MRRQTIACPVCYEHIITLPCFANQDGDCGAPYPLQSVIIVSYLRSGANTDTVMGIAIGYLCITREGNFGGPVPVSEE